MLPRTDLSFSASTLLSRLTARPAMAALLFAGLQALVWTLAPALTHHAPPLDVTESYLWGHEWVVGTFKHPNMPGWVLELSRELTGATGWPAYLASQLFVATTLLFVFLLGREMMDLPRALAGMLLLFGVFYFAWPTIEFNHNVAQMPFWAGIAWMLWRLRSRPEAVWWALLGFLAADSLYAKLSSGLLLFVAGLWILYDRPLRKQLAAPGPWIGFGIFLVLTGPLLIWLIRSHFAPLLYAAERSAGTGGGPLEFLGAQLLACLGLIVLAAAAGLIGQGHETAGVPAPRDAIMFLSALTLAPLLLTALVAGLAGAGLKSMWGSPMLGLSGLLTVALTSQRFSQRVLERLAAGVLILLTVLPLGYGLDTLLEGRLSGKPKRQNWPQAAIATRFDQLWREQTGKPLRIVTGERWVAGLVALKAGPMPSILTDGDLSISPWITQERLARQGTLVVWEMIKPDDPPPGGLYVMLYGLATGVERFRWPLFPGAPPLLIGYAIVPPG